MNWAKPLIWSFKRESKIRVSHSISKQLGRSVFKRRSTSPRSPTAAKQFWKWEDSHNPQVTIFPIERRWSKKQVPGNIWCCTTKMSHVYRRLEIRSLDSKPGSICSFSSPNTRSIEIGRLRTSQMLRVYTAWLTYPVFYGWARRKLSVAVASPRRLFSVLYFHSPRQWQTSIKGKSTH